MLEDNVIRESMKLEWQNLIILFLRAMIGLVLYIRNKMFVNYDSE